MFFGTTPSVISQFLAKEIASAKPERAFVPFAGNFVAEQICGKVSKEIEVHSTDVSMYSRAIGFGLTDTPFDAVPKPEAIMDFPEYQRLKTPIEKAALVVLFVEIAKALSKRGKIKYYDTLYRNAIQNQAAYLTKMLSKLNEIKESLNMRFYGYDACRLIPEAQKDDLMFYDPPVLIGDYEKMFRDMEACFTFTPEPYTIMTEELKWAQLEELTERGVRAIYRTNHPLQKPPKGYKQIYQYWYKWHGHYCLYSNFKTGTFVGRWTPLKEEVVNIPIIDANDRITVDSKVEFIPVQAKVANHYRMMWVKKAEMTDTGRSFLILVDGKLIGMVSLLEGLKFGTDLIVIVSDPAAPTSSYSKLSRLVIMLTCTQDTIEEINRASMWSHEGFTTRVFTNNPVSMKYRGLFDLHQRKEAEGDHKYCLIYQNRRKIYSSRTEALKEWVKKYATNATE